MCKVRSKCHALAHATPGMVGRVIDLPCAHRETLYLFTLLNIHLQWQISNRILNKYNVEATNSVMLGLPGETRETIQKTLDYLNESKSS